MVAGCGEEKCREFSALEDEREREKERLVLRGPEWSVVHTKRRRTNDSRNKDEVERGVKAREESARGCTKETVIEEQKTRNTSEVLKLPDPHDSKPT